MPLNQAVPNRGSANGTATAISVNPPSSSISETLFSGLAEASIAVHGRKHAAETMIQPVCRLGFAQEGFKNSWIVIRVLNDGQKLRRAHAGI